MPNAAEGGGSGTGVSAPGADAYPAVAGVIDVDLTPGLGDEEGRHELSNGRSGWKKLQQKHIKRRADHDIDSQLDRVILGSNSVNGTSGGVAPHIMPARSEDVQAMMQANPLRRKPDATTATTTNKGARERREPPTFLCDYCRQPFSSFAAALEHEATCPVFCDFDRLQHGRSARNEQAFEVKVAPGNIDPDMKEKGDGMQSCHCRLA